MSRQTKSKDTENKAPATARAKPTAIRSNTSSYQTTTQSKTKHKLQKTEGPNFVRDVPFILQKAGIAGAGFCS